MQQEIWFQKYQILGLLGKGGNAEVYLAEHIKLNAFRAIKCISKNHPLYDLQCKEALILKNLKHSCIPIIYDIEEDEDGSYIVEQYIEGDTLKKHVTSKGPIREETAIKFGLQLCDLIRYLHSFENPILYVDLKPDNIILSGMTLKLIDFGSAVVKDEPAENQKYCGTKGYAAPELYRNHKIDERCDVYGIGMLLYFMVTGLDIKNESTGINNIDQFGSCSGRLKNIINNCLKFNPSQRFSSVSGLSKSLSAMVKKSHFQSESSQTVKIAVAGAGPRIGVTHLSFRLCKYLTARGYRCLYEEKNLSGCVRAVKGCYEEVVEKDGMYLLHGINMLPGSQSIAPDLNGYNALVQDFGCLTGEKLEEFLTAGVRLVIMGAKDWELTFSQNIINMTAEYKDIIYLFNFVNGKQFQQIMRSMEDRECYRIPYEPDPYARITPQNGLDFFRGLLNLAGEKSMREKAAFLRRGKGRYETKADTF